MTIIITLLSIALTFIIPAFDSSIYGVNGHPTEWLSFNPSTPLRHGGPSLILSPFIHLNSEHILTNLFFFIPLAMVIERKKSKRFLFFSFTAIHMNVLIFLLGIHFFLDLSHFHFLGSSHIIIGLYVFWALLMRQFSLLFFPFLFITLGYIYQENPLTSLPHGLGLVSGILLFIICKLWNQLRVKTSN